MADGTVLLLGCGPLGLSAARHMSRERVFRQIIFADTDAKKAQAAAELAGEKARGLRVDGFDEASVAGPLADADVLVNTMVLPRHQALSLIRSALESGASYTDCCKDTDVLQAMFESQYLAFLAEQRAVSAAPGLGMSPGLSNALTSYLAQRLERTDEARFCLADQAGIGSEQQWRDRLADFASAAMVWRDGAWRQLAPLSESSGIGFPPPTGTVHSFLINLAPITLPESYPSLNHVSCYRGFSDPAVMELVANLVRLGFGSGEPAPPPMGPATPREFAAMVLAGKTGSFPVVAPATGVWPEGPQGPIVRQAMVSGTLRGRKTTFTMTYQFPGEDDADSVAATLAVGARLLMTREVSAPGVHTTESLDPAPFLWDMERRGAEISLVKSFDEDR